MAQNLIIPNRDNKVVLEFGGIDLTQATNIILTLIDEEFSTTGANPKLLVTNSTTLSCDLSATTKKGKIFAVVTYYDSNNTQGIDITSQELNNLGQIIVAIGSQLIIEDGSIVDNANAFTTDQEFKDYANLRCMAVPPTEPARDALQILAMDYLFDIESSLQGVRTNSDQELPFPRVGVCARNKNISSNAIPKDIKRAVMELALQANTSELLVSASQQNIQREKLGDLEVEYFSGGSWAQVRTDRANAYLNEYKNNGGNNNYLERV